MAIKKILEEKLIPIDSLPEGIIAELMLSINVSAIIQRNGNNLVFIGDTKIVEGFFDEGCKHSYKLLKAKILPVGTKLEIG